MLTIAYVGGGWIRGHAYVIIFWKKRMRNLQNLFQGKVITSLFYCKIFFFVPMYYQCLTEGGTYP